MAGSSGGSRLSCGERASALCSSRASRLAPTCARDTVDARRSWTSLLTARHGGQCASLAYGPCSLLVADHAQPADRVACPVAHGVADARPDAQLCHGAKVSGPVITSSVLDHQRPVGGDDDLADAVFGPRLLPVTRGHAHAALQKRAMGIDNGEEGTPTSYNLTCQVYEVVETVLRVRVE